MRKINRSLTDEMDNDDEDNEEELDCNKQVDKALSHLSLLSEEQPNKPDVNEKELVTLFMTA